jgi:hypothetical protein
VATALLAQACSGAGRAPLAHTAPSTTALAEAVLAALATNDRAGLESLALSEREFRDRIWPELPASRPERNVPLDYAWGDLHQKSTGHLQRLLAEHGGRRYELVRVEFLGETTGYRTFTVARKAQLLVRDERGQQEALRLFGSVVESGEQYKVFSFVVD